MLCPFTPCICTELRPLCALAVHGKISRHQPLLIWASHLLCGRWTVANESESPMCAQDKYPHVLHTSWSTKMPPQSTVNQIRLDNITTCLTISANTAGILASSLKIPFMEAISNTSQSLLKNMQVNCNWVCHTVNLNQHDRLLDKIRMPVPNYWNKLTSCWTQFWWFTSIPTLEQNCHQVCWLTLESSQSMLLVLEEKNSTWYWLLL